MPTDTLIIFDYSGTLSIGSVLFGRPEHLVRELELCGLAEFGVGSLDVFWERIVNPTWQRGSTTPCGYTGVMQEAVEKIQPPPVTPLVRDQIASSVESFVSSYFSHSRIDERWRPLLVKLHREGDLTVAVATDHYAEATGAILRYLAEWRIRAIAAWEAWIGFQAGQFLVANSADLGVYKSDPEFWRIIRRDLQLRALRLILVVDDFGFNEEMADRYSDSSECKERKEKTVALLRTVFPEAAIEVIPFFLRDQGDRAASERDEELLFGTLIDRASVDIERHLDRRKP